MKISVDDVELFTLSDTQKNVICNDIPDEEFDADMKRRLQYVLTHKYEQCFRRLKEEWEPKLAANGVTMIPTDADAFAQLVFAQPNYQSRSQREAAADV
jgi:hypothetical protein